MSYANVLQPMNPESSSRDSCDRTATDSRSGSADGQKRPEQLGGDDRAIAPTIAVILMLAGTILLAMIVVPFILSVSSGGVDNSPNAEFSFVYQESADSGQEDDFNQTGANADGLVTITFNQGDRIDAGQVSVKTSVSGGSLDETAKYDSDQELLPGEEITIWANRTDVLRIIWISEDGDTSDIVADFKVLPGGEIKTPGVPEADEDCSYIEARLPDDVEIDGVVVDCDLRPYDIDDLDIINNGANIGEVEASGTLDLESGATYDGDVNITGDIDTTDSSVTGNVVSQTGGVDVDQDSLIEGSVTANGDFDLQRDSTIRGDVTMDGDYTVDADSSRIDGKIVLNSTSASINNLDDMYVGGKINATAATSGGKVVVQNGTTVDGGITSKGSNDFKAKGDSTVNGDIDVTSNAIIKDNTKVNGQVETDGNLNFGGSGKSAITGHVTVGGSLTCNDATSTINGETCPEYKDAYYEITIDSTNTPVTEGETLDVTATIENTRYQDGSSRTVTLEIDGTQEDSKSVSVSAGSSTTKTFQWSTVVGDQGDYTANISSSDDFDTTSVTVGSATRSQNGTELEIDGSRSSLSIGLETKSYNIFRTFDDGTEEEITDHNQVSVSSADSSKVTVDESSFEITGQAEGGSVTVSATNNSYTGSVDVTVDGPSADQVNVKNPSGDTNGVVTFDIENTGIDDVDLNAILVNSTNENKADVVNNDWNNEFSGAGGSVNTNKISIGASSKTTLGSTPTISSSTTEAMTLKEFRWDSKDKARNMKGQTVTLTLYFLDGSKKTVTLST